MINLNRNLKSSAALKGRLCIEINDAKTGKLLRTVEADNLIVNDGLNLLRDLLGGQNDAPTHIAVGTTATAPTASDTLLNAEVFRNFITRRIQGTFELTFQLFLAAGDANGNTLREAGIFNRDSAGDMFSHVVFADIIKTGAITATLTWIITFTGS